MCKTDPAALRLHIGGGDDKREAKYLPVDTATAWFHSTHVITGLQRGVTVHTQ